MRATTLLTIFALLCALALGACSSGGGGGDDDDLGEAAKFLADFLSNDEQVNTFTGANTFALAPHIAMLDDSAFVAWREDRDGGGNKVFLADSNGDEDSFLQEFRVDDAGDTDNITALGMAASGDNIYIVYFNATDGNLYMVVSNDAGDTFEPEIQVNVQNITTDLADSRLTVCADGDRVYILWKDDFDPGLSFRASSNGGASFLTVDDVRVDDGAGGFNSSEAGMICSGANVFIVWRDTRDGDGGNIYFNKSTNGGTSFVGDERVDDAANGQISREPVMCLDGDELWIAWEDTRNGGSDIFMAYSSNAGNAFNADRQVNVTAGASNPVVACSDGFCFFAFTTPDNRIFLNRIDGGTAPFLSADVPVESAGGSVHGTYRIGAHEKNVYVAWTEADGTVDFNYSKDRGATFPTQDRRISDNAADAALTTIRMITLPREVRVVWQDDRNSPTNSDIFYEFGE